MRFLEHIQLSYVRVRIQAHVRILEHIQLSYVKLRILVLLVEHYMDLYQSKVKVWIQTHVQLLEH